MAYTVFLTNSFGSVTSSAANLYMYPYLSNPFQGLDTYWGQTNSLSVGAGGSEILCYQWYQNSVAIQGATNPFLTLDAIQFTNTGLYSVVVTNSYGSVTNPPFPLIVNVANISLQITNVSPASYPAVIIQGTPGYPYVIESSTDLGDTNLWIVETNIVLTQPIQNWNDENMDVGQPSNPKKFYRVLPGQ